MAKELRRILSLNVDPILFWMSCLTLALLLFAARAVTNDIDNAWGEEKDVLSVAFPRP
jgi:hypothetical protein